MPLLIPALVVIIFVVLAMIGFAFFQGHIKGAFAKKGAIRGKTEEEALKQAGKRLTKNPNDAEALLFMGEFHYKKADWDQTLSFYQRLAELPGAAKGENEALVNVRAAEACVKLDRPDDAHKYLLIARSLSPSNFDVNYQLGILEFQRKNYEKAVQILQQARAVRPDHASTVRTLGHALFRLKKNKDAMLYIRQSIDLAPNDKESLFTLAECYCETGQTDQAMRIYAHLRPDPIWGAQACLASGNINLAGHQDEAAISDFEIGLKHKDSPPNIELEIRYQLANTCLKTQDISRAMSQLNEIVQKHPDYKDVPALIAKYQEMYTNRSLQIYTIGSNADFIALCRKIAMSYFPRAKVKITKTNMHANDWNDILAEVDTPKWSDVVMFRFIRTQGSIGELVVRDFHSHLKDAKAGKGICMGVGQYSDEARRFTEARLIDLIDKGKLTAILAAIDSGSGAAYPPAAGGRNGAAPEKSAARKV